MKGSLGWVNWFAVCAVVLVFLSALALVSLALLIFGGER